MTIPRKPQPKKINLGRSHAPKKKPPKGVIPPQLQGKGFREHPENINKYGAPKSFVDLRKLIVDMGNDVIDVEITLPDGKKKFVQMKRIEALLLDMYNSDSSPKQDNILSYGFGKVPDKLEVTDKKTIRVTIEKKESANDSIS